MRQQITRRKSDRSIKCPNISVGFHFLSLSQSSAKSDCANKSQNILVLSGLGLVLLIHPGNPETKEVLGEGNTEKRNVDIVDNFLDLGRNLFPDNIFKASFQTAHTQYSEVMSKSSNGTEVARELAYR